MADYLGRWYHGGACLATVVPELFSLADADAEDVALTFLEGEGDVIVIAGSSTFDPPESCTKTALSSLQFIISSVVHKIYERTCFSTFQHEIFVSQLIRVWHHASQTSRCSRRSHTFS
mmetsp:Transcript_29979/g.51050  ORF Transcript_29979/g.51050 Transcript_29979/m.51050 type:complete len:118 (+) Transcript_29979:287-640(+)